MNTISSCFEDLDCFQETYGNKKLPCSYGFYKFPNSTQLLYFDPEILIKYINFYLSEIDGIRGDYNKNKFLWELEWGTRSIEDTIDRNDYELAEIIKHKKYAAIMAAFEGKKRILNELQFVEDDEFDIVKYDNHKWCKFTIILTYSIDDDSILIEYNRLNGDATSYYAIINKLKNYLNDEKNLNWFKRLGYISFINGIDKKYIIGDIMKYICNDMLMREICSFI